MQNDCVDQDRAISEERLNLFLKDVVRIFKLEGEIELHPLLETQAEEYSLQIKTPEAGFYDVKLQTSSGLAVLKTVKWSPTEEFEKGMFLIKATVPGSASLKSYPIKAMRGILFGSVKPEKTVIGTPVSPWRQNRGNDKSGAKRGFGSR